MIQIGQIALKTFVMRRSRMKQEKTTYCRLCEANCGLLATVEDDRVIAVRGNPAHIVRSEEHTSELQSLMRISYAVFCLKKKKKTTHIIKHKDHLDIENKALGDAQKIKSINNTLVV